MCLNTTEDLTNKICAHMLSCKIIINHLSANIIFENKNYRLVVLELYFLHSFLPLLKLIIMDVSYRVARLSICKFISSLCDKRQQYRRMNTVSTLQVISFGVWTTNHMPRLLSTLINAWNADALPLARFLFKTNYETHSSNVYTCELFTSK
jgi:hypothetical protein